MRLLQQFVFFLFFCPAIRHFPRRKASLHSGAFHFLRLTIGSCMHSPTVQLLPCLFNRYSRVLVTHELYWCRLHDVSSAQVPRFFPHSGLHVTPC
jgi:hypothetical protein